VAFDLLNIISKIKLNSSPKVENDCEENDSHLFDREIGTKIKLEDLEEEATVSPGPRLIRG
jgi:hypothetical protein